MSNHPEARLTTRNGRPVIMFGDRALSQAWDREAIRAYAASNTWDSRVAVLVDEFRRLSKAGAAHA